MNNRDRANLAIGMSAAAAVAASTAMIITLHSAMSLPQPDGQPADGLSNAQPIRVSGDWLRYNQCLQEVAALYPGNWGTEAARWCDAPSAHIAQVTRAADDGSDSCFTYQVLGQDPETVTLCG